MRLLPVKLEVGGQMPTKGTQGSAGYDLYAPKGGIVYPGDVLKVPMGIRFSIPNGYCGILTHRSSMSAKGVSAYGLIDEDYRGEIILTLMNIGPRVYQFKAGDRIAQIRFVEVPDMNLIRVQEIPLSTDRGEGSYGSTGV